MNLLVIGSGGREHAIARALLEDQKVKNVFMLPKPASIKNVEEAAVSLENKQELLSWIQKKSVDLVVIGPEKPLVEGLGDFLRQNNLLVFGPSSQAAQLEGSKIFSKQFMKAEGIPTASYQIVSSVTEALEASKNFAPPYVLKADGLAGGKGVFICKNLKELEDKSHFLFEQKGLGEAGDKALLENFQTGVERSVFILTNGKDYKVLPVAQDYKRLLDNHEGPNTGGMGAIAPLDMPADLMKSIEEKIIQPTLEGMKKNNYLYYGVLYIGLMVSPKGARVLEYNVRFGDPETQILLPLLDGSWGQIFYDIACGKLPSVKWKENTYTACVVLASPGYPSNPKKGISIKGSLEHQTPHSYFLHAGVGKSETGEWVTKGGRVLNAISIGSSRDEALKRVYEQVDQVFWEGKNYRKDIGLT